MGDFGHIGRFELLGELGHGSMARVWRAWDPMRQCQVAVKEPLFDVRLALSMQDELGRRFASEARVAMQLSHPGIVRVFETGVWDGRPAIVMELVEGETLARRLSRGRMAAREALDALGQLLDAVGYAHDCGVVHRDIKPDNIFLTRDGTVKLADFGIARIEGVVSTVGTLSGTVLGTPGYLSPEQALGKTADARSDLFSVGVIAYEMLTGVNPFMTTGDADATTLIYRIVHEPAPELPRYASEGLPADLRPAVMQALSKDPSARPRTAAEFKALLHADQYRQVAFEGAAGEAWAHVSRQTAAQTVVPTVMRTMPARTAERRAATYRQGSSREVSSGGASPRTWLPYALVLGAALTLLVVSLSSATSGVGGGSGGTTAAARQSTGRAPQEATASDDASGGSPQATDDADGPWDSTDAEAASPQGQAGFPAEVQAQSGEAAPTPSADGGTTMGFTRIGATSVLADGNAGDFGAARAVDGDVSTAWGEGSAGSGASTVGFGSGESIWLVADDAQEVRGVRIMAGYACDEETYGRYNRCRDVYVALSDGTLFEVELSDAYRQYQTIDFGGVYRTEFVYVSLGATVYEGSEFDSTMISEIQVY